MKPEGDKWTYDESNPNTIRINKGEEIICEIQENTEKSRTWAKELCDQENERDNSWINTFF